MSTAQPTRVFNSTATTQTITGLVNGASYTFKIAARTANGTGPQSPASAPITVGAPVAPTGATVRGNSATAATGSVTVSFAAIEGGSMEGVEAVGNLRNATAVFTFARGHWTTAGKAVFNLNPDETLAHFTNQYERVEKH